MPFPLTEISVSKISFDPGSQLMETNLNGVHSWCELVEPSCPYSNLIASTTTDLHLEIKLFKSNSKYFYILSNDRDYECMFFDLSNLIISRKNTQLNKSFPLVIFSLFYNCFTFPLLCVSEFILLCYYNGI